MGQSKNERMLELVELLNKASRSYYQDAQEIMSNYEYDRLYDELQNLEKELGRELFERTGKGIRNYIVEQSDGKCRI